MPQDQERLPALGQPAEQPEPDGDHDFAGEHDSTAVSDDVITGGSAGETESPAGWSGLDREGPP